MQEQIQKISKKEFMNMLAKADVDDTTEFWESIYDGIYQSGRENERERIIKLVKSNSKGSFTDVGGNDCWYIDDLVKNLSTLTNNKDE